MLDDLGHEASISLLLRLFALISEFQSNLLKPLNFESEKGECKASFFHFFLSLSVQDLGIDKSQVILRVTVCGAGIEIISLVWTDQFVHYEYSIEALDLVRSQVGQPIVCCCVFHLSDLGEHLFVDGHSGRRNVEGQAWIQGRAEYICDFHQRLYVSGFFDPVAHKVQFRLQLPILQARPTRGHRSPGGSFLNLHEQILWVEVVKVFRVLCMSCVSYYQQILIRQLMQSSETEHQKAFKLDHKVSCPKHPSKTIEYFCQHPQCTERLSCSACLLKKQYCRHDINTYVADIAELLYDQKMAFAMKGLSKEADIHDYLVNKEGRRKMYDDVVNTEITRFENDLGDMLKNITKTIEDLKFNIISQLEEFKVSYQKTEELMLKKVEEAFSMSYMANYESFEDVLASRDYTTTIGLRQLLEKLVFEGSDDSKAKDIRKYYENLMSMHDQTPEIDYNRLESIKSYFNVFQNKLSQAGPLLITLHKSSGNTVISSSKDINPNAMMDPLPNISPTAVKKIAKSASFSSNHSRTVYVVLKLPERKIITGSDDGAVNMFDMTTFENIGNFQCHIGGIRSMVTLPNSKLVTGSYDKTIKIWPDPLKFENMNLSSLQLSQLSSASSKKGSTLSPLKTLTGHTSCIISLKYLNDGLTFASGSADYSIKVWDYEKGQNTKNFTGHMSDILCLDCTSTGNTLVSGSADRTIKVWSLTKKYSSACLKTMTGHLDFIWTIVLLQDNITLLSAGLDKTIKMWDITVGNLIRNLPTEHTSHITRLIQYAKQVVVSCSNDGTIKFWDFKANACAHTLQLESGLSTMLVTPEQGIVAVGQDKNIYLCD